jgi:flagellar protein FliO/FliZ
MDLLFGGMPDAARFFVAFLLVLGLIGAAAFLWRKFGTGTLATTGPRGRQPRLAVIDAASVDGRRRLVLVRRDNIEHLLMIGGPTDIVVEPNINRAGANANREPRPIPVGDVPPRQSSPVEAAGWTQPFEPPARPIRSMEDLDAGRSEPAPRSAREAMADTMRAMRSEPATRTAPVAPIRHEPDDEITAPALTPPPAPPDLNFPVPNLPEPRRAAVQPIPMPPPPAYEPVFQTAPEPPRRVSPPPAPPPPPPYEPVFQPPPEPKRAVPPSQEPVSPVATEPQWPPAPPAHESVFSSGAAEPKRAPAAAPRPSQNDESNLAEMAQRLEAALRRPTKPVEPPPAPPPAAAARPITPASRAAAHFEPPSPKVPSKAPEPPAVSDLRIPPAQGKGEAPFESLEDEMAKMLGRTPGKT